MTMQSKCHICDKEEASSFDQHTGWHKPKHWYHKYTSGFHIMVCSPVCAQTFNDKEKDLLKNSPLPFWR